MDCRHKPTEDDILMYEWIKHFGYDVVIVATKSDKLNRTELVKNNKLIRETLALETNEEIINISSLKKTGVKDFLGNMFKDSEGEPSTSNESILKNKIIKYN